MTEKKVGILYTLPELIPLIREEFSRQIPGGIRLIEVFDGIIQYEELTHGETPFLTQRLLDDVRYFEETGCCAFLNTCSAFRRSTLAAREAAGIPVFAIDEPVAQQAVAAAENIAVVKSIAIENDPALTLLREEANRQNKEIHLDYLVAQGALEEQMAGHQETFERMVTETILSAAKGHDAVVLVQASLHPFAARLQNCVSAPIFSSVASGIGQIKAELFPQL